MIWIYGAIIVLSMVALYVLHGAYVVFWRPLQVRAFLDNDDVTIVTGIFDIGNYSQGVETKFSSRNFEKYLAWFRDVAQIDVNMVIFVPSRVVERVGKFRERYPGKTRLYPYDEDEFVKQRFFPLIEKFIAEDHPVRRPRRIEMQNPMYNAVMFSKIEFVRRAITENPFDSNYFLWLDGGYGHGLSQSCVKDVIGKTWPNQDLLKQAGRKILFNQVSSFQPEDSVDPRQYFYSHRPRFAGNCWGGDREALLEYAALYVDKVYHTLEAGYMDDDQAIIYAAYWDRPDLFHVVSGSKPGLRDYLYMMKYLSTD